MRSQFASLRVLVLPFGAITGTRIVIDGISGNIQFYDANDNLVGFLSPDQWYTGLQTGAHVQLDPFGGLRIFDNNGLLAALLNSEGLQIADPANEITPVNLTPTSLLISTSAGSIETGVLNPLPGPPKYGGTSEAAPGTTIDTPAVVQFGAADIEIRHAATARVVTTGTVTFTPPASYTEDRDSGFTVAGKGSISTTIAHRQPAVSNAIRTFTASASTQDYGLGATVVIKGLVGGTAPSIVDITSSNKDGAETTKTFSITPSTAPTAGNILIAFVCVLNATGASLPTSWSTPVGWKFLGAQFRIGASSSFACGVFYKIVTASEPATYDFTINTGTGYKLYNIRAVEVQNAFTNPAGPDVQINGDSIGRGIVAQQTLTANSSTFTADSTTDMVLNDVPVVAGRMYAVSTNAIGEFTAATGSWELNLQVNGVYVGTFARVSNETAAALRHSFNGTVYWTATATQATDDFTVQADERTGTADLTLIGGTTETSPPRTLTIIDIGIVN